MRVAFATHDRTRVDAHFNGAKTFLVYDISAEEHTFLEALQFDSVSNEEGNHTDEGDDRLSIKVKALEGISLLFVRAIGGPAAARVVRAKIHPIKLPQDEAITSVIDRIRGMLHTNPPPWLRKVIQDSEAGPERFIDDED